MALVFLPNCSQLGGWGLTPARDNALCVCFRMAPNNSVKGMGQPGAGSPTPILAAWPFPSQN